MEKNDVLIIRSNLFIKPDKMKDLREGILEQMKDGVVLLPPYCEAVVVPDDLDIQIACKKEEK